MEEEGRGKWGVREVESEREKEGRGRKEEE